MNKSIGILRYGDYYKLGGQPKYIDKYKVNVQIDQGISDFYRSLIPKYIVNQPQ